MRGLKSYHFSNYLFNMLIAKYNSYLSNPENYYQEVNDSIANHLFNSNTKNIKPKKLTKFYPRKFKSPKDLNYHFKYKAPQFNDFTKRNYQYLIKDFNELEKSNKSKTLNIFTNHTKNKKNIILPKNDYEYKINYDPKKITNNFIKFNASKEYSKLSQKFEKNNNKENNDEINNKTKMKLSKTKIKNDIVEGYFGRKVKTDVPCLFDVSSTFYNFYSNKSEKCRHEIVLNELNKLKAFIINDPKNKIHIFKNFLIKFNYKNIDEITDEQIKSICDFVCINDNDILFHLIKPYFKSKDIISDLINNIIFIIRDRKDILFDDKGDKTDSQEIFNNNNDSLLKNKIFNKEKNKNIFSLKNKNFSKTQNYFYNKMQREKYKSPFYIPFKSHKVNENNNKNRNIVDLDDTNSLLKLISYQKKIQLPARVYSLDNYSLINEISKEIRELKENFDKTMTSNQFKKFSILRKKGISKSPIEDYNSKNNGFKLNDNKNIFSKTCIQYHNKNKKNKQNKQSIPIKCLNNKDLNNLIMNSKLPNKKKEEDFEKRLNEINERMYYKQINYEFGYKQIKDLYKITEVAAINFAKKRKFKKINFDLIK